MTLTDGDRRANLAAGELCSILVQHANYRRVLSKSVIQEFEQIVSDYTSLARKNGIKEFPELVVIVLPDSGGIECVRRDLTNANISVLIKNLTIKYMRTITVQELAKAIKRAFPHYHPDDAMKSLN